MNRQAALARDVVKAAKNGYGNPDGEEIELTGAFIRDRVQALVLDARGSERMLLRNDADARRRDLIVRAKHYQEEFVRGCHAMNDAGLKLGDLHRAWPKDLAFPITSEFREAMRYAKKVLTQLEGRL